jgi:hypothetical protein
MKRSYRKWTQEDDATLRRMVGEDVAAHLVGDALGRDEDGVMNRLRRIGLKYPPTHFKRRGLDNRTPTEARIWKHISPEPMSGCWLWTGALSGGGYGYILSYDTGRRLIVRAHRWLYEHTKGPIPEGLQLDHKCRVRSCVNPDHLEPVTSAENTRRGRAGEALREWVKHNHWRRQVEA